jgi:lon-related putative ATP-dependent protease
MVKKLTTDQLRRVCDPQVFSFGTTAEVDPLDRIIGQDRAIEALKLGLGIKDRKNRYNIYVAGGTGTGKMSAVEYFLSHASKNEPTPPDLCYVHNFDNPYSPKCLELTAGMGVQLRDDMDHLISRLKGEIPKVFESDDFKAGSKRINERFTERRSTLSDQMETRARELGFAIQRTPIGINTLPLQEKGEPLSQEEYAALSEEERAKIRERQGKLQSIIQDHLQEIARIEEEREEQIKKLAKDAVLFNIEPRFNQLKQRYGSLDRVVEFLDAAKRDIVENLEHFRNGGKEASKTVIPLPVAHTDPFKRYQLNVLVDNSKIEGAPVIVEQNATYTNLFGSIERRVQMGVATTDFTMIKPGSLHRANGGYLVLNANNLFRVGLSWDALKIAIKRREIRIEDPLQMLGYATNEGLKPEPVPFRMKVVIIGNAQIYELLHYYDEDFPKLFSVKSEFDTEMDRTPEHEQEIARFLRARCDEEPAMVPFDSTGVAKVVEYSSELAGDQKKLSCQFGNLISIVKEASYWARQENSDHVAAKHVLMALSKRDNRLNLLEDKIQEMMARGQLLVDTQGVKTGQVNGLAVLQLGDYMFGKPSRITATVHTGKGGIVDIEREAELGGHAHTKGIMILKGFLGEKFASKKPLSISASIAFEQIYSMIDGDSASSTELYALLSSLSDLPIEQGLAITGSVNQKGEIQPIGGVNEKIEGFFKICKTKGLTGKQGVIIPQKNVDNLMLSEDIVEAVHQHKFHIYPVETVEQGIEILTGVPAGEKQDDGSFPEGTVFGRVATRLEEIRQTLKEEESEAEKESATDSNPTTPNDDSTAP